MTAQFDTNVNVGNKTNQIAQIFGDLKKDTDHKDTDSDYVGANSHVGDGEFRDLMGGNFNYKHVDKDRDGAISDGDIYINDAYNLLEEMLLGDGISGVSLVGLDGDSFTLAVDGKGGSVDFLVFEGQAAMEAITLVDQQQGLNAGASGFDLNRDGNSQFAILDLNNPDAKLNIGASGNLNADGSLDVGNTLTATDVPGIMEQVLQMGGYSGVNVVDVDTDSITLSFNGPKDSTDTLLIKGVDLSAQDNSRINLLDNNNDDFVFMSTAGSINVDGNVGSVILDDIINDNPGTGDLFDYGTGNAAFIKNDDADDILAALVDNGGFISVADEELSLIGVDSDNMTIALENTTTGATDYLVFDFA